MSIIVDSTPILRSSTLKYIFNFFPKSSLTSKEHTALNFEDIFALGAARGNLSF